MSVFKALGLLILIFLVRLVIIHSLPLTGDEAYYWQWSRHLALGYHDHPPLIGWLIRTAAVFGKSAFWVRFPAVVLSFLSGIFFFLFSKEILQDSKKAFYALLLYALIPIFSVCALAIFPDGPLVFSWSLFLWAAWKWRSDERYWPIMGLALGLAALSKLMGLFLLPSFLLFLFSKDERGLLKRPSLYAAVGFAFLLTVPTLYWNYTHHFETLSYQAHQRLSRKLSFSPGQFFNYASLQLVAISPFILALIIGTIAMLFKKSKDGNPSARFLLSMALPIHLFFLIISFFSRVGLHWALPGYLSLLTAVPVWVDELSARKKWIQPFFAFSIAFAALMSFSFLSFLHWPEVFVPWISSFGIQNHGVNQGKKLDSPTIGEIFAYEALGKRIDAELQKKQLKHAFVFTDSYSLSSDISFYANIDAKTLLFTSTGGEYDRWNHFEDYRGGNALYVDTKPIGSREDIDRILHKAFKTITPLPALEVSRGPLNAGTFYFAVCTDFVNPQALQPTKPW